MKFLVNFILSLIAYVAIIFLGFFLAMAMYFFPNAIAVEILIWVITLISATLFFMIGTKLNLLGKHWLNYLSVFGTFVITLPFSLKLSHYTVILVRPFPVFMPSFMMGGDRFNDSLTLIIATLLPSIFTWLGMLYKSRKLKKKQSETTD